MSDSAPDLGAMVSKLLGNPELISQIASTVGLEASPISENKAGESEPPREEAKEASAPAGGIDQIIPMLSVMGGNNKGTGGGGAMKRSALLSALKPFCNEHRCRTIDYMIGISKLSETLTQNKRG